MPPLQRRSFSAMLSLKHGFSLIEILMVMAILALLSAGAIPAFNVIRGGQDLGKSAYDVAGMLEQARSYAMAKNTYVYVAMSQAVENSSSVQLAPGGGRLVVAVMASKTGVRPTSMSAGELVPMNRLQAFDNLKLDTLGTDGNMGARKSGADVVSLADSSVSDFAGMVWSGAGASLTFDKVIEFDPAGVARFTDKNNIDGWIEIPLKPARGSGKTMAALQVDGSTGVVRIYRP